MSNLNTPTEDAAQAVFRATGKCLLANRSVERLAHLDPEKPQSEKSKYEHHLLEAIAAALSIKDEFYKGLAIRQVINVCRNANDIDIEKTLFKEVDHPLLREQIVKDAPELAGERKEVSDEDSACRTVTIHLDGLERDAILHNVTKAMRDIGASEREIEGFSRLTIAASKGTVYGLEHQFDDRIRRVRPSLITFHNEEAYGLIVLDATSLHDFA
jgi:hypothetical protein